MSQRPESIPARRDRGETRAHEANRNENTGSAPLGRHGCSFPPPAAVRYNNRLARHWKSGIPTRHHDLEDAEAALFLELLASPRLAARRGPDRPVWNPLIIDLGGGTGKVVGWLDRLLGSWSPSAAYLYYDIAPAMRSEAEVAFERLRNAYPGRRIEGWFHLTDVSRAGPAGRAWRAMRRTYFPIVTVCAGGTIGNFGPLRGRDDAAQRRVFANWIVPADGALVTFLDPSRIGVSLAAYSEFGLHSGLYDGQRVQAYVRGADAGTRELGVHRVSFTGDEFAAPFSRLERLAQRLARWPFWLKLEMTKHGRRIGQVTRHFTPSYAREVFLDGIETVAEFSANRAWGVALCAGSAGRD